jgi:indole-3-glycerol phosphate synthase
MNTLEEIVEATRSDLRRRRKEVPIAELERALEARDRDRPFSEALIRPACRSSPSTSAARRRRARSGPGRASPRSCRPTSAAARRRCRCSPSRATSAARWRTCARPARASRLPILRKDFIVDPYQLYESVALGADAILLIVAALDQHDLEDLHREARELDLDVLVEVTRPTSCSARSS